MQMVARARFPHPRRRSHTETLTCILAINMKINHDWSIWGIFITSPTCNSSGDIGRRHGVGAVGDVESGGAGLLGRESEETEDGERFLEAHLLGNWL